MKCECGNELVRSAMGHWPIRCLECKKRHQGLGPAYTTVFRTACESCGRILHGKIRTLKTCFNCKRDRKRAVALKYYDDHRRVVDK